MGRNHLVSTGIQGLDQAIDMLRTGDTVTWQMEDIGEYIFVATQFVVDEALTGRPMIYLRFGDHEELVSTEVLRARGTNIKCIKLDPTVGFEIFAVQVHRIISTEPEDSFFLFDCLSDLQRYWFSDLMICNFFCLALAFRDNKKIVSQADDVIFIPRIETVFSAALAVVPLQLLAYYAAKEKGCDIDKPKNLAKSVTVE